MHEIIIIIIIIINLIIYLFILLLLNIIILLIVIIIPVVTGFFSYSQCSVHCFQRFKKMYINLVHVGHWCET